MNVSSILVAAALVLGLLSRPSFAEDSAASCSCDAKANTLTIRYTPDVQDADPIPSAAGLVRFMSLLTLDKEGTTVEDTRSQVFQCRLKADRFEVTFEPGVPNPNLLGRCGAAVTGIVTVMRNGALVVDEQEFEAINCHEREKYVKAIIFKDGSATPTLVYSGYGD